MIFRPDGSGYPFTDDPIFIKPKQCTNPGRNTGVLMKPLPYLFIVICSAFLVSCDGGSSLGSSEPTKRAIGSGTFKATIGTEAWASEPGSPFIYGALANDWLHVSGQSSDTVGSVVTKKKISLYIHFPKTGTFTVGQETSNVYALVTISEGNSTRYYLTASANSGTISITKLDSYIRSTTGTFSITVHADGNLSGEKLTITTGSFDIAFQPYADEN